MSLCIVANANVQEENLINSRPVEVKYEGLPLSLSSFPVSHNAAGIAGMGAGDLVVDMLTDWLTFVGGCKE